MEKRWLSKSQINLFLQCPLKWKFVYIDEIKMFPSPQQERGSGIHKEIENFYKDIELVKLPDKPVPMVVAKKDKVLNASFYNFEKERIKHCITKENVFDEKYFKPLYQELKVNNEELRLRGIIDAIYVNSKDDGLIVIDWKSGKFRKNELNNYRFELAVYKELFEKKYKQPVKYWGMYFIDAGKLFFEEVEQKWIDKMYETVNEVRTGIEKGDYKAKPNIFCNWCDFKDRCKNVSTISS